MSVIIGIDLGGTQLRVAAFLPDSITPIQVLKTPTRSKDRNLLERLMATIDSIWPDEPVAAICAACPGPVDSERGILLVAPNIPGWVNFPLSERLSQKYHVPIFLENDANLAAVGEWYYGAGRGHHHLIYLTISTGIGGGVIINDQLLTGARGLAAEIGHLSILPDGPLCSCGKRGHLEAIASGTAIARYVSEQIAAGRSSSLSHASHITAKTVAAAARNGDELALEAFQRAGNALGQGIADLLHIFNPSILVFGGGVSQSGDLLFAPIRHTLEELIMSRGYLENLTITKSQLGDEAGLLGTLAQARLKLGLA